VFVESRSVQPVLDRRIPTDSSGKTIVTRDPLTFRPLRYSVSPSFVCRLHHRPKGVDNHDGGRRRLQLVDDPLQHFVEASSEGFLRQVDDRTDALTLAKSKNSNCCS